MPIRLCAVPLLFLFAALPARAEETVPPSASFVLPAPAADTAVVSPRPQRFSRTLLVIRGIEKISERVPLLEGPARLMRRYYDATHTDRYAFDVEADPRKEEYQLSIKIRF